MRDTKADDFVDKLQELYPKFTMSQIKKIISMGCHNIVMNARNHDDILLHSGQQNIKVLIYNYNKNSEKGNQK